MIAAFTVCICSFFFYLNLPYSLLYYAAEKQLTSDELQRIIEQFQLPLKIIIKIKLISQIFYKPPLISQLDVSTSQSVMDAMHLHRAVISLFPFIVTVDGVIDFVTSTRLYPFQAA